MQDKSCGDVTVRSPVKDFFHLVTKNCWSPPAKMKALQMIEIYTYKLTNSGFNPFPNVKF